MGIWVHSGAFGRVRVGDLVAHNNVSLVNFCTISPSGTNLYYYGRTVMVQNFTQPISGTNLVPLI